METSSALMIYHISVKGLRMFHFTHLIHSHSNSLLKLVFLSLVLLKYFFLLLQSIKLPVSLFKILMVAAFAGVIQRAGISNIYSYTG